MTHPFSPSDIITPAAITRLSYLLTSDEEFFAELQRFQRMLSTIDDYNPQSISNLFAFNQSQIDGIPHLLNFCEPLANQRLHQINVPFSVILSRQQISIVHFISLTIRRTTFTITPDHFIGISTISNDGTKCLESRFPCESFFTFVFTLAWILSNNGLPRNFHISDSISFELYIRYTLSLLITTSESNYLTASAHRCYYPATYAHTYDFVPSLYQSIDILRPANIQSLEQHILAALPPWLPPFLSRSPLIPYDTVITDHSDLPIVLTLSRHGHYITGHTTYRIALSDSVWSHVHRTLDGTRLQELIEPLSPIPCLDDFSNRQRFIARMHELPTEIVESILHSYLTFKFRDFTSNDPQLLSKLRSNIEDEIPSLCVWPTQEDNLLTLPRYAFRLEFTLVHPDCLTTVLTTRRLFLKTTNMLSRTLVYKTTSAPV
jgi:hypothetical protein